MPHNPFASTLNVSHLDHSQAPQGNLSYVAGVRDDPLAFITVSELLDQTCEEHGSDEAAVFPAQDVSLSWYSLREKADDLAAGLLALGIERGSRVAIWSPNRVEWLVAQFGTARIGAILVNINPAYRQGELEFALNKTGACVLIMARQLKSIDCISVLRSLAPEMDRPGQAAPYQEFHADRLPELKHVIVLGEGELPSAATAWREVLACAGPAHRVRLLKISASLDPDDAINIQFTSGTTGEPKGATLSHYSIVNNARHTARAMALSQVDRVCIPVPLYHCFGMVLGVLACASSGSAMVFPGESFDATETLKAVSEHRCSALYGVPTMFVSILERTESQDFDVTSLRTGIMAGASCPVELMQRVISDLHMEQITIAYGMTETSPVSFQTRLDDSTERRVSTVGRIHPHVEAKIINGDGRIVPVGVQGELCTRGYSVMQGYWGETSGVDHPVDSAGWMHTGDLAVIDREGYCSVTGRVSDMIIRGGENIYPREVEACLMAHPLIDDAQVFGIAHEKLGEVVCAWCILRSGAELSAEAVKAYCDGSIAHFKVPLHVRFVPCFPMTVTGKPRKTEMQDLMIAELGNTALADV